MSQIRDIAKIDEFGDAAAAINVRTGATGGTGPEALP